MNATKEAIKEKGYQILADLNVTEFYKDQEPTISEREILIFVKGGVKKEDGWHFTVSAPNWQFDNDQGAYSISFF